MSAEIVADFFSTHRNELTGYLRRLVVRPSVAEELVQETMTRALELGSPKDSEEMRYWAFTVANRLAIDHLRRHGTWREELIFDARDEAESRPAFLEAASQLRGDPEMASIARQHLVFCLSCVLRQIAPHRAAALLLKEVYDFTNQQVADMLGASFGQAKQWIQDARRHLRATYAGTCALTEKQGVCYQCVELDGFFNDALRNPLEGEPSERSLDARLELLGEFRSARQTPFHVALSGVIEDLLDAD